MLSDKNNSNVTIQNLLALANQPTLEDLDLPQIQIKEELDFFDTIFEEDQAKSSPSALSQESTTSEFEAQSTLLAAKSEQASSIDVCLRKDIGEDPAKGAVKNAVQQKKDKLTKVKTALEKRHTIDKVLKLIFFCQKYYIGILSAALSVEDKKNLADINATYKKNALALLINISQTNGATAKKLKGRLGRITTDFIEQIEEKLNEATKARFQKKKKELESYIVYLSQIYKDDALPFKKPVAAYSCVVNAKFPPEKVEASIIDLTGSDNESSTVVIDAGAALAGKKEESPVSADGRSSLGNSVEGLSLEELNAALQRKKDKLTKVKIALANADKIDKQIGAILKSQDNHIKSLEKTLVEQYSNKDITNAPSRQLFAEEKEKIVQEWSEYQKRAIDLLDSISQSDREQAKRLKRILIATKWEFINFLNKSTGIINLTEDYESIKASIQSLNSVLLSDALPFKKSLYNPSLDFLSSIRAKNSDSNDTRQGVKRCYSAMRNA